MAAIFTGPSFHVPALRLGGAGGNAASSSYKTTASLGQPLAGAALTSTNYKLQGGLIPQTLSAGVLAADTATKQLDPSQSNTVTLRTSSGVTITLEIPANAFSEAVTLTARLPSSFAAAVSNIASLKGTNVGVEITTDKSLQPQKTISLVFTYQDADVQGLTEDRLVVAYYDETGGRWVPIPSTADPANNKVTGRTNHFTVFQVVELAPAPALNAAFVYPNPLRPGQGHTQMNLTNLPADTRILIFTPTGEKVRELTTDNTGRAAWDGLNEDGEKVASGVYLALIRKGSEKETVKIAVER